MNKTQMKKAVTTLTKIENLKYKIGDTINTIANTSDALNNCGVDLGCFVSDIYSGYYTIANAYINLRESVGDALKIEGAKRLHQAGDVVSDVISIDDILHNIGADARDGGITSALNDLLTSLNNLI